MAPPTPEPWRFASFPPTCITGQPAELEVDLHRDSPHQDQDHIPQTWNELE